MTSWTAGTPRGRGTLPAIAQAVKQSVRSPRRAVMAPIAGLLAILAVLAATGSALATPTAGAAPKAASSVTADAAARPVVLVGISGLRWTDISASTTPALWRLAEHGSVGSLVVSAVRTFSCPADAWLTVNSGARATATSAAEPCRLPEVIAGTQSGPTAQAQIPSMNQARSGSIEAVNKPFSYAPCWGVLGNANSPGPDCPATPPVHYHGCATAIGPGAALALAGPTGQVQSYTASATNAPRSLLSKCQLTVVDLGVLPGTAGRANALRAADQAVGQIVSAEAPGAITVVAGIGDDTSPQVHAIIVSGPGFGAGLLKAASTRQPAMVASTDLTPSILAWLGRSHTSLVGSVITTTGRGTLTSAVTMLVAQNTAAQVYRSTLAWFFLIFGVSEFLVFVLLALLLRGIERKQRRLKAYRIAGVSLASVPAGTFLASVVPWAELPHPALVLYALAIGWAAVIAAAALTGPWRRDPFGPAGFVGTVTAAVIAVDVITGSHLQLSTPFGLPVLVAGRWYGIGNNALGIYATAGIICATWAGVAGLRKGSRSRALAVAWVIAVVLLVACASPAWGAKVGGTIAMTPALALVLLAIAGVRVTPMRAGLIAVSGVVLITGFAVLSYIFPAVGVSDIGAFVGHVLHGSAGPILNRKANANLHSVTETWFTPIVPVLVAGTALMLVWPEKFRLHVLARATAAEPMLRPMLTAIWTACVLGWLADDSGVSVTAAALPLALPLAIVIVTGIAAAPSAGRVAAGAASTAAAKTAGEATDASGMAATEGPVQTPGRQG